MKIFKKDLSKFLKPKSCNPGIRTKQHEVLTKNPNNLISSNQISKKNNFVIESSEIIKDYKPSTPKEKETNNSLKNQEKILVVDLDETLIHSSYVEIPNPDVVLTFKFNEENDIKYKNIYVLLRPGCKKFISILSNYYEIILFIGVYTYEMCNLWCRIPRHSIRCLSDKERSWKYHND